MSIKQNLAVILVVLSFLVPVAVSAAEPVGQIISLQGNALVVGSDGKERALSVKDPVFLNDKVVTKSGAKLQVLFLDDSVMSQGENSEMTIDEYVYAPGNKESNRCSVRIAKGLFRLLTGKITAINPDRFQVKTRMATIGIRGCDLGFKVTELSEDVYVIQLHGQESVTVTTRPGVGGGEWTGLVEERWDDPEVAKTHLINVLKSNRIISISQGSGASQREMTPDELVSLINAVTPPIPGAGGGSGGTGDGSGGTGDASGGSGGSTGGTGDGSGGTGDGSGETGGDSGGTGGGVSDGSGSGGGTTEPGVGGGAVDDGALIAQQARQAAVDAALASGDKGILLMLLNDPLTTPEQRLAIEARLAELAALEHQAVVDAAIASGDKAVLNTLLTDPATTDAQRESITARLVEIHAGLVRSAIASADTALLEALLTDPMTTPEQRQAIEVRLLELTAAVYARKGGGTYWEWGIWKNQGVLDRVEVKSSSVLSASDFQGLVQGANMYYLSGAGDAAAVINHAGENRLVAGFADPAARAGNGVTAFGCTVNVQLGKGTVPSWDGAFSMDNSLGDTLRFDVDSGTILATGELMGTPSVYNMNVHGTVFNRLTTEALSGALVGPGAGAPPAGVIGRFHFTHEALAIVDGIFGADLH